MRALITSALTAPAPAAAPRLIVSDTIFPSPKYHGVRLLLRFTPLRCRHREEQSDEAIQSTRSAGLLRGAAQTALQRRSSSWVEIGALRRSDSSAMRILLQ